MDFGRDVPWASQRYPERQRLSIAIDAQKRVFNIFRGYCDR